jgi:hypothetical protein
MQENETILNTKPVTEVTSIAKEEEKSGVKANIPSPDQLVANAAASMQRSRMGLMNILSKLSKKGTARVLNAIFELPQDNLPVTLKGPEEKMAFALGQRIQSDRFLIIQHFINKEIMSRKEAELNTTKQEETTNG